MDNSLNRDNAADQALFVAFATLIGVATIKGIEYLGKGVDALSAKVKERRDPNKKD